jgi:AcrR family transcriptional regulator
MKRKDAAKARDILDATVEVVNELGIAGLSMEAVAKRAGVATGTLYVYHAGKEALIDAAYAANKQALVDAVFRETGLPVRPAFLAMASAYLEYLVEHQAEIRFLEQVRHAGHSTQASRDVGERGLAVLAALLERGKREMLLKDLDPALAIAFLQGTMREMSAIVAALPKAKRAEKRDLIARLCWDAIAL